MKILVICGSSARKSRTRGITELVHNYLKEKNIETLQIDLGIHNLPLYTGEEEVMNNPDVIEWQRVASEANGFFIATPEYHNGMSGSLKNALDYLRSKHFKGKAIAISAAAGGGKGGINALNNLRIVLRGVYGLVLPEQFVADPEHFNEHYQLIDSEARERIRLMVDELINITSHMKQTVQ
ncbi:NADPH-dependent FMN reductase [Brevibacillus brevis]|uniref:NADPH-dependent FMN reductase n=1 Tax=Brevibacillus brevis TaxID=1393 RepID=UPI001158B6D7|nr:NADPH-dependent FMN reductase [Lysinibacillus sp. SDF0063]TQR35772.1 NADPH-dependent oxidoreductase [Lysinibacillus sp. SDF0063]